MAKKKEINIKNIKSFIEGNTNYLKDKMHLLPKYYKEQVVWRASICKESCIENENSCEHCGCEAGKKIYVEESCNNGEKFPDLMSEEDWEEYKKENDITIYV
ncbi:MAG: hypothetical protein ACTH0S_06640 [Senegalia sp. (in: firmicutes)]